MFELLWHPGLKNLTDYQSKHHVGSHHAAVRPYYLHQENLPQILPCALRPSTLKGCVGTLEGGYVCNVPLRRVPQIQSANHVTTRTDSRANPVTTRTDSQHTCYSQVPCVPTWSDLDRLFTGLGRNILPFSPV